MNPNDGNGDVHFLDVVCNDFVNGLIDSWNEFNWRLAEVLYAMLVNIFFTHTHTFGHKIDGLSLSISISSFTKHFAIDFCIELDILFPPDPLELSLIMRQCLISSPLPIEFLLLDFL